MTRSFKKSPYVPIVTTETAKPEKVAIHRRERHAVRQMLHIDPYVDVLPESMEFGDARLFAKEFYCYVPNWGWPELVRRLRK
jgi:hypothetical protein